MKKQFFSGIIKKVKDGIEIIASDESMDRHGEVLKLEDWDLKEFKRAPRLLVDHDHRVDKIVGKAEKIKVKDGALTFSPLFHEITELARSVKDMVEQGFLNSVSVGFIPHRPEKDGDRGRNELIEISFVTVGANQNALVKAFEAEASTEEKDAIEEFTDVKEIETECNHTKVAELNEKIGTLENENDVLTAYCDDLENTNKSLKNKCEKQSKTLTQQKGRNLKKAHNLFLKEVAHALNRSLYKSNKENQDE